MMTKVLCDNSPMVEFLISTWLVLVMAAVRLSCNWAQNYFFSPAQQSKLIIQCYFL